MSKFPEFKPMHKGERYGRLVVLENREVGQQSVRCRCDCGNEVVKKVYALWHKTRSCGCLKRDVVIQRSTKHGKSGEKIYWIWADMVGRCTNPNHARYADYGGRGITVYEPWLDFANFYADMGDRPKNRVLDRLDNDDGYHPENCAWVTLSESAKNRRSYGPAFPPPRTA